MVTRTYDMISTNDNVITQSKSPALNGRVGIQQMMTTYHLRKTKTSLKLLARMRRM